jgi:hypothetical protein
MPHITIARTGRTYHDIDSTIASLFVEAGLAEYLQPAQLGNKPTPRPTVPTFVVGLNNVRNKFELVCTLPSGAVQRFDGAPSLAKNAFKANVWSASAQAQTLQGPEPSAAVLAEYAHAYGLPAAEALAYETSKRKAVEMQAEANNRAVVASANEARARAGQ